MDETFSQTSSCTASDWCGKNHSSLRRLRPGLLFQGPRQHLAGLSPMSNAIQYHPFAFDVQNRRLKFEEERVWNAKTHLKLLDSQLLEREGF